MVGLYLAGSDDKRETLLHSIEFLERGLRQRRQFLTPDGWGDFGAQG